MRRGAVALALALAACAAPPPRGPAPGAVPPHRPTANVGTVEGRVLVGSAETGAAQGAVVFLDGPTATPRAQGSGRRVTIRNSESSFSPATVVVGVGQPVEFHNDGSIYHKVFSYSESNAFDLGVFGAGDSRTAVFASPGVVRFYCSLHGAESGTIFVAPSPYFAHPDAAGSFRIADVAPGRYRLRAWSESGIGTGPEIIVKPGATHAADVALLAADPAVDPAAAGSD